mgnify:FL=1
MVKDLEARCRKAILKIPEIADTVRDISMKLCHLIEYYKNGFYKSGKYNGNGDYYS